MFGRRTQTRPSGTLTQRHIRVNRNGADHDTCLIYLGDQLVSLLVRLQPDTAAPEHRHKWRVTETYGPCRSLARAPLFDTPDAVIAWIARHLPFPAPNLPIPSLPAPSLPAPSPWLDAHLLP